MGDRGMRFAEAFTYAVIKTQCQYFFISTPGRICLRTKALLSFTKITLMPVMVLTFVMATTEYLPPSFPAWRNTPLVSANWVSNGRTKL